MLLMDFPDAVAPISTHAEVDSNLAYAEQYLESVSYGKLDIEFAVMHRWLRSRYDHTHYLRGFMLSDFDSEAVEMADPDFDFTGYDIVMTVLPSAHFGGGTATGSVKTDEGVISATVRVNAHALVIRGLGFDESTEPQDWGWVAAHELLHALGLSDLYPVGQTVEPVEAPPGKLRFSARSGSWAWRRTSCWTRMMSGYSPTSREEGANRWHGAAGSSAGSKPVRSAA